MKTLFGLSTLSVCALLLSACAAPVETTAEAALAEEDGDAAYAGECPATVPDAIHVAADQQLAFSYEGDGVQIYTCNATANGFAWVFKAPRATLVDDDGDVRGIHFAGPSWQANDGSTIVGARVASAPATAAGAIPWLLLNVASHSGPPGKLSKITSIQRLNTSGGVAPAVGCDAAHLGVETEVPYTAGYFFYKTRADRKNRQCGQHE
jgi:hypothetical protein